MIASNDLGLYGITSDFQHDAYGRAVRMGDASAEGDASGFAQPDGKIIAAGQRVASGTVEDIALVRYHDAVRLYVQQDANFNVTAVTDSAGTVLERYIYEPYGSFTVLDADWAIDADGLSDNGQTHLHQGGRYDAVSGTYHFRNRDFSPSLGRWVQQDPMGYVDGMSLYEYVRSSPQILLDATGLATVGWIGGGPTTWNDANRFMFFSALGVTLDEMERETGAGVLWRVSVSYTVQRDAPPFQASATYRRVFWDSAAFQMPLDENQTVDSWMDVDFKTDLAIQGGQRAQRKKMDSGYGCTYGSATIVYSATLGLGEQPAAKWKSGDVGNGTVGSYHHTHGYTHADPSTLEGSFADAFEVTMYIGWDFRRSKEEERVWITVVSNVPLVPLPNRIGFGGRYQGQVYYAPRDKNRMGIGVPIDYESDQ